MRSTIESSDHGRWLQLRLQTFLALLTLAAALGCLPPDSPPDVDSINAVCFSPDGTTLATGGYKQVELWDANTGKRIRAFGGHSAEVYSIAFSPDGRYLAAGGRDKTVRVLNPTTGQDVTVLRAKESIIGTVFSPDSRTLISADLSGRVIFWNTDDWKEKWRITSGIHIMAAALSSDGNLLAVVVRHLNGRDAIESWSTEKRARIQELSEEGFCPREVAFSQGGDSLAAIGLSDKVVVWNGTTGTKQSDFRATDSSYSTFSPDGQLLATGGRDGKIQLWNAETGQHATTLEGYPFEVECLAFSPDCTRLASAVRSKKDGRYCSQVLVWDITKKEVLSRMTPGGETADKTGTQPDSENPR